jgi:hypothetical protein
MNPKESESLSWTKIMSEEAFAKHADAVFEAPAVP